MQILRSKSKKRGGVYLASKKLFCQVEGLFLQQGRKIEQKRPLFVHVYEPLVIPNHNKVSPGGTFSNITVTTKIDINGTLSKVVKCSVGQSK